MLAAYYPNVLQAILHTMELANLWEIAAQHHIPEQMQLRLQKKRIWKDKNVTPTHVTPSLKSLPLNERQLWFMQAVRSGKNLHTEDIVCFWDISLRTAKRDIHTLVKAGLINF